VEHVHRTAIDQERVEKKEPRRIKIFPRQTPRYLPVMNVLKHVVTDHFSLRLRVMDLAIVIVLISDVLWYDAKQSQ